MKRERRRELKAPITKRIARMVLLILAVVMGFSAFSPAASAAQSPQAATCPILAAVAAMAVASPSAPCPVLATASVTVTPTAAAASSAPAPELSPMAYFQALLNTFGDRYSFADFLYDHQNTPRPEAEYIIEAASYTLAYGMYPRPYEYFRDKPGTSLWTGEEGIIEWQVNITQAGLYNISLLFYNILGRNTEIQRSIFINGQQPFFEAGSLEFHRTWVNQLDYIRRDSRGNDMRPTQIEQHRWTETVIRDDMATYPDPLLFYFEAGLNTITLKSMREPMVLRHLRIFQAPEVLPYAEVYRTVYAGLPRITTAQADIIRIEGHEAARKSSPILAPIADNSGPGVYPYSPRYVRINTIGGESWSRPGAWIEWEVYVPIAGLYHIALNVRQNYHRGTNAFRRISINGQIPFAEMNQAGFGFRNPWRVEMLGGNDPFLFYLQAGYNTIRMEAVLGGYAYYYRRISEVVLKLNELYRQVVMIVGPNPDPMRDYQINDRLPHLRGALQEIARELDSVFAALGEMTEDRGGARNSVIRSISRLITIMYSDIESIPQRMGEFGINMGGLGTWMMMVREQMLAIDAIYILPVDAPLPRNRSGFWRQVWHEIRTLFLSFVIDFNTIGDPPADGGDARSVEVWIGTGRDQANTIRALIDESFTRDTGIGVTLKLVDMGTLLPATVARQGPDVALSVGVELPMNFAFRGAVADLSGFPQFQEVAEWFPHEAMVPFRFRDQAYALPETFVFPMLFYRRDVLHEIGLEVPDNWDDVRSAIFTLNRYHMDFGLPAEPNPDGAFMIPDGSFGLFLFQAGGDYYDEDGTRSTLDSPEAIEAFANYVRFYTDYNIPRVYNFLNRFRRGDMPLAIANYTAFNLLQVFAPEIRGLWGFRPVPGTPRPDGTIDRSVPSTGLATIMLQDADDKYASWEFMKWWTSADIQTQFGHGMEALMGAAARHPTANFEAFQRLPWAVRDYHTLMAQFPYARGIPQVPGAYFTPRYIRNAFFSVVEDGNIGPRSALANAVRMINAEIEIKRREFGLDD